MQSTKLELTISIQTQLRTRLIVSAHLHMAKTYVRTTAIQTTPLVDSRDSNS